MKNIRRFSKTIIVCIVASASLRAQTGVSQISGAIHDPGGLAVPGAQVSVVQTDTGLTRTVQTGQDGSYLLPSLPVGRYQMTITKDNFKAFVQSGIVLQVDSNPAIDATLQLGSVNQQVVVQADASMVETQSSGVGQVVDQERVVDLPLNGRNPEQLIFVAGGATVGQTSDLNSSKNYPTLVISVAGGLAEGMTFLLDGGTHNDPFNNLNLPIPFPDALQEFKVETSALPAEYGQHAAAAINMVTKSGGNEIHGDAFEFLRNGDLDARDFFATARDTLRRNQYGGVVGGPIKKDKLFFFVGYQGTIQRSDPTVGVAYIPTQQMLAGDFSAITSPACNGGRQIPLKAPFVNNQLAPSLFSAPAVALTKRLPTTNDLCGKVQYGAQSDSNENLGIGKVDYQINAKHSLFGRYYLAHYILDSPYNNNDPLTVTAAGVSDNINSFVLGDTYLFNPTTISSFHATFNRAAVVKGSPPFFSATDLGVNMTDLVPGFSVINVTGAFSTGGNTASPGHVYSNTGQLAENISMVRGAHQVSIGVNWIKPQENTLINLATFGLFTFSGQATGLGMGDLLTGNLSSFSAGNPALGYQRGEYVSIYAQDSWRLSSRLTVNAGIRWEPFLPVSTKYGYEEHFDLSAYTANVHSSVYPQGPAGLTFPGDAGYPGKAGYFGRMLDFAPRLGIVFDPKGDGRMTVRSSFGIFYDNPNLFFDYAMATTPPYGDTIALTNPPGGFANPWAGYPGGNPFPTQLGKGAIFPTSGGYLTYPFHVAPTYMQQWNLSIEKQVGANWLVSGTYIGNHTLHMWVSDQFDPAVYIPGNCAAGQYGLTTPGPCSSTANTAQRRSLTLINPVQGAYFSGVANLDDGGTGTYNALLLAVKRRMAKGVTVLANYTWSHCISDVETTTFSPTNGATTLYPDYRRPDHANCTTSDRRQVLNVSAVVQSPKFANRWLAITAGNWQLSTILSAQSGNYFNVTTGVDNALSGQANQRPNLVGSPIPANQSVNQWLIPAAFQSPSPGTYGDLGANTIVGPGMFELDMGASRLFPIRERWKLEFRAEAFNLPNRVNLNNPTSTLSSGAFGRSTADFAPRIMQVAMKFIF